MTLMLRYVWCAVLALSYVPFSSAQTFTDQTSAAGLAIGPHGLGHSIGRGAAWDDFDNDGDEDLFIAEGVGGDYAIWWNQGNGTFLRQVVMPGYPGVHSDHSVSSADFDNDGDQDVFVAVGGNFPNLLFVNQGNGAFSEDGAARGVADPGDGWSATWGDADRDGWLDLYVGNREGPGSNPSAGQHSSNIFYRNNGDGTFTDVTAAAGLSAPSLNLVSTWFDYDQNGWPDLLVGNDKGDGVGHPLMVFRNEKNGTFSDQSAALNANPPLHCMGFAIGDTHNDGEFDVFMTNIPFPGNCLLLWDSATQAYEPQSNWAEDAISYGVIGPTNSWGTRFFDADQDGWLDLLYVHNISAAKLMKGTGGAPFIDVSASSGVATGLFPGYSCAAVDYDGDGDLDIFTPGDIAPAKLLRNDTVGAGNWLQVRLEGTLSNRDGFGAQVIARTATSEFRRMKLSGEGYLVDGTKRLHFGLGSASIVDELEIRWPSGTVQYLSQIAINQLVDVTEPSFGLAGTLAPGTATTVSLSLPDDAFLPYACGLTFDVFSEYELGDGRSVLVNVSDPLLLLTSTPGNNDFQDSTGFYDATGLATMTLNIPPLPFLSGLQPYLVAASWNPNYTANLKSIIGPQRITIP